MPKKANPDAEVYEVEYQAIIKNCEYFINEFVYIESKGTRETEIKFKLWPLQRAALKLMLVWRLLIFLKARQLGCTWLVLAYATWLMLRPAKKIIALSKTEDDAKELVHRVEFILRHLPEWFIKMSNVPLADMITYDPIATRITVYHPGKEPSVFMALPAGPNSGASLTADLVIIDEWGLQDEAEKIYRAAYPTINDGAGQLFGVSTMRIGSFFYRMVKDCLLGLNDYKLIFWPWNTNPARDQEWYERAVRNYAGNMKSDYPATIEEALSQAEGCFFNELNADTHIKQSVKIPDWYKRYASIDFGLDGYAVIWYYVDDQGMIRVYRELYDHDKVISTAADMFLAANRGDRISGFFAPPDLFARRQETGKSLAESFAEKKIYLTQTFNNREKGWLAVKELLKPFKTRDVQTEEEYETALLTINAGCAPHLWRCLSTIQRDPNNYNDVQDRPGNEIEHELTHLPDAFRYFAAGRTFPSIDNSHLARQAKLIDRLRPQAAIRM
jgi:hypothetical protein